MRRAGGGGYRASGRRHCGAAPLRLGLKALGLPSGAGVPNSLRLEAGEAVDDIVVELCGAGRAFYRQSAPCGWQPPREPNWRKRGRRSRAPVCHPFKPGVRLIRQKSAFLPVHPGNPRISPRIEIRRRPTKAGAKRLVMRDSLLAPPEGGLIVVPAVAGSNPVCHPFNGSCIGYLQDIHPLYCPAWQRRRRSW
jgi:hypothetical protein